MATIRVYLQERASAIDILVYEDGSVTINLSYGQIVCIPS